MTRQTSTRVGRSRSGRHRQGAKRQNRRQNELRYRLPRQIRHEARTLINIEQGAQPEKRKRLIKFRDNVGFLYLLFLDGRKLHAFNA